MRIHRERGRGGGGELVKYVPEAISNGGEYCQHGRHVAKQGYSDHWQLLMNTDGEGHGEAKHVDDKIKDGAVCSIFISVGRGLVYHSYHLGRDREREIGRDDEH